MGSGVEAATQTGPLRAYIEVSLAHRPNLKTSVTVPRFEISTADYEAHKQKNSIKIGRYVDLAVTKLFILVSRCIFLDWRS